MSNTRTAIAQTLARLAATPGADDFFALQRVQVAGEPTGWRDEIAFERGQFQSYARNRSAADEGGAAIGVWRAPAEESRTQRLADALCRVRAWNCESDAGIEPGQEVVNWTCVTAQGILDLSAATSSALMRAFMPVDLELRRIANTLEEARAGAQMRTGLRVQMRGASGAVMLAFGNDGTRRYILPNPLRFSGGSEENYFRLELAPMPEERPGETGYGAEFQSVPLALSPAGAAADPWQDEYFVIGPGERVVLPSTPVLGPLAPGAYLLRAVYSYYGLLTGIAGVPVIRGRSFSNEVEIKV